MESVDFKRKYLSEYKERIDKIQNAGIRVYGTFIVGLDEDSENVFEETADFIGDCNLYGVNITVPTPLPGTKMREQLERDGRIISNNWGEYTLWDVVIQPQNMSVAELEEGLFYIYKRLNEQRKADERLIKLWRSLKQRDQ